MRTGDTQHRSRGKYAFGKCALLSELEGTGGIKCTLLAQTKGQESATLSDRARGGSYLVGNPAVFQLGTANGRRPSHSCVNMGSGLIWRFV